MREETKDDRACDGTMLARTAEHHNLNLWSSFFLRHTQVIVQVFFQPGEPCWEIPVVDHAVDDYDVVAIVLLQFSAGMWIPKAPHVNVQVWVPVQAFFNDETARRD